MYPLFLLESSLGKHTSQIQDQVYSVNGVEQEHMTHNQIPLVVKIQFPESLETMLEFLHKALSNKNFGWHSVD